MNDDRRDDRPEPFVPPGAGTPQAPAGNDAPAPPPPPVAPSHDGGSAVPPPPSVPGAQRPSDYYAQPPASPETKSGCKKWGLGCGVAGCLVAILFIVGIVWVARSGWPMLMSRMVTEVEEHIDANGQDLDPALREELRVELAELKRHIEDGDVSFQDMQDVIYPIQDVVGDEDVTTSEAEELLEELKRINEVGATGEF